ncbi:MAG: hypothetical protein SCH71_05305 [Desulfobulbaceae bacterium]|nr:hypothetical protein [Desulfobulbaceae bacterium]
MNSHETPALRLHLALFLLSAALIAFQLEQMQLLALVQWHHFAYLIISVALLGFGVGGTVLALFKPFLLRHLQTVLPLSMFGCAIMMAVALPLSQGIVNRFDISLLFVDPFQAVLLLAAQSIYLLIFLLGALPLGLVFVHFSSRIGSLYCANLIGSGAGGILIVAVMYFLLPQKLPALTALFPWVAALLVTPRGRPGLLLTGTLSLVLIGIMIGAPLEIKPSQYKAVSRTLDLPESEVVNSRPSPYGLVQVVTAPVLRHAPGLSLTYTGEVPPVRAAVFNNGDWFGAVGKDYSTILDATAAALPYALRKREKVLVLDAGTGADIEHALAREAEAVRAVEPHRRAVLEAAGQIGNGASSFLQNPKLDFSFLSSRTWLATDEERYDLITLPEVGSFGGAAGLFALQEEYLLTRESFLELWDHLAPEGALRVSAWLDSPPRNPLRLAATIIETLEDIGVDVDRHVAAIRGWDMITFLVQRAPLNGEDIRQIRDFCELLQFDPVILPGLQPQKRQQYHFSAEGEFFDYLDILMSPERRENLYQTYAFNLRPVTDNRPFFSQYLRWQNIPTLKRMLGERSIPFLELGYVLVLVSFVQMAASAVLLILLPLLRLRIPGRGVIRSWIFPYFSGLGIGYIFFEIVLIHELVLYFGNPIFAAAAVISSLLIFSGLGSLYSGRLIGKTRSHASAAAIAALLLLLYLFILPGLLQAGIGLPLFWKVLFFLVLISPPSFVMGMPFPLGLNRLAGYSKSQAAWAWGINGSVSVASTGLAAIIAVELGFSAVMLIACGAYVTAAFAGYKSGAVPA